MSDGAIESGGAFGLPIGTVTFLLTDIEGSTLAWSASPMLMGPAVARHYEILDDAVARHGGVRPQEQGEGDSIVAAFSRASDALRAAVDAQVALGSEVWPEGLSPLKVRMAVHAGEAQLRNEANYVGQTIIRTARLRAIAHGGQVVVSQAARDLTVDQLGTEIAMVDLGTHRLKDLARPEHVWQVVVPGGDVHFPPLKSLDAVPNNLPMALSTFVGRSEEIETVVALAQTNRLVTITGAGGAGKTRLGQHVAANLADRFVDGAWWIDLAPHDASAVRRLTADIVSVKEPDALADRLSARSLLLVFDNCEHVLDAVAPLIADILQKCPGVRIVATSRGPLDVPGEVTWRVPPLGLPTSGQPFAIERLVQFDAVRLFLDRARRARPNFELTNENGPAVAEICSRLDGLPLAIELAAARAKSLTPQQILSGLEHALRLLTGGSRLVMARQQTIEASIAWSHDLLSESERIVMRRVSVFVEGWDLEAAEAVCADGAIDQMQILDSLERLIDQSLIRVDDGGAATRYRALETVRQFGAARLADAGEAQDIAGRHARHYLALATEWAPRHETAEEDAAVARMAPERANVNAALRFLADHASPEELTDAAVAMTGLYGNSGWPLDGVAWCTTALDRLGERAPYRRAAVLQARVKAYVAMGQVPQSFGDATACLALVDGQGLDLPAGRARAQMAQVLIVIDPPNGLAMMRRAIEELERADDRPGLVHAKMYAAAMMGMRGDIQGAEPFFEEARLAAAELGNPLLICGQVMWESACRFFTGDHEAARRGFELIDRVKPRTDYESLRLTFAVHFADDLQIPYPTFEQLEAYRIEALRKGQDWNATTTIGAMMLWLQTHGEFERALSFADEHALSYVGVADRRNLILLLGGAMVACALGMLDDAEARLNDAGPFDAVHRPGTFVPARQIASLIALGRGALTEAETAAREALDQSVIHGRRRDTIIGFQLLAAIAGAHGSWAETARLAGVAGAAGERWTLSRRTEPCTRLFEVAVESARNALGTAAFDAAFAEGAGLTIDEAVEFVNRSRGERGRPTVGWAALTPTERSVADLVRSGMSNAAVGAELLMGAETVKTHLSRVFAKLDVNNRTKLAALTPPSSG